MKKLRLFFFCGIAGIITLVCSCEKNDSTPSKQSNNTLKDSTSTIIAKTDGVAFTPDSVRVSANPQKSFYIYALNTKTKEEIMIGLWSSVTKGAHAIDQAGYYIRYFNDTTNFPIQGLSGNITINNFDTVAHYLSGTFAFTAKNQSQTITKNISDGVFTIKY